MTDPVDELANVAEDAIKRADAAEAKLTNAKELRARLDAAEAKQATEAKRKIRDLIAEDAALFNQAFDEKRPELMQELEAMGKSKGGS